MLMMLDLDYCHTGAYLYKDCIGDEDMKPFFSIIVVALNPGDKLIYTLNTIWKQSCKDYEIIIKDGLSTDGSIDQVLNLLKVHPDDNQNVRVYQEKDAGIYEAMNQAVKYCEGEYYFFLNCGDAFYSEHVLLKVQDFLNENSPKCDIAYGNCYNDLMKTVITSAPKMNGFTCYRNVPCHQTCFYHRSMFEERAYNPEYKVRGDYEHFLWCFYTKAANIKSMNIIVSYYEGGGYSETKKNIERSRKEHKEITGIYMTAVERARYQWILIMTLAPIRKKIAASKSLSGCYNRIKSMIYRRK